MFVGHVPPVSPPSYLYYTSGIKTFSHHLAFNLACRMHSSYLPFIELLKSRSYTKVETWNVDYCGSTSPLEPIFAGNQSCPSCVQSKSDTPPRLDPFGSHAAICPSLEDYIRRHSNIFDKLICWILRPDRSLNFSFKSSLVLEKMQRPIWAIFISSRWP